MDFIITVKWQFEDDFFNLFFYMRNSSTSVLAEMSEHVSNVAASVA